MDAALPVLDLEHLSRLRQLTGAEGPGKLVELFRFFLDGVPPQLERMRQLLARNEWAPLAREAHSLAGSSAMYGMPRVRLCCKALEGQAKEPVPEGLGDLLAAVETAFAEALPLLRAELALE